MSATDRRLSSSLLLAFLALLLGLTLQPVDASAAAKPTGPPAPVEGMGVVYGQVKSSSADDAYLNGVTVQALDPDTDEVIAEDVSGDASEDVASGYFELQLPPGSYDLFFDPMAVAPDLAGARYLNESFASLDVRSMGDVLLVPPPSDEPTDEPTEEPTQDPEPTDGPTDAPTGPPTAPVPAEGESVIWGLVRKDGDPRLLGDIEVQAFPVDGDGEASATSLTYGGYGYRNGVFALYVPPGSYDVRVTAPDGSQHEDLVIGPVTVSPDQVFFKGELSLPYRPGLLVRVFDLKGQRVDGARVDLTNRRGALLGSGLTRAGRLNFADVPESGRHRLVVSGTGYQTEVSRVRFEGGRKKATVYLSPAPVPEAGEAVIWGVVRRAGDRRFPQNVTVQAFEVDDESEAAATSVTYGGYGYRGGVFALYVPAGTYRVVVSAPPSMDRSDLVLQGVTVAADQVSFQGLVSLPRPPGVLVRAIDRRSRDRIEGVSVRLVGPEPGATVRESETGSDGRVFFSEATTPGRYQLSVSKIGFDSLTTSIKVRQDGRARRIFYLDPAPVAEAGQSVIWGVVGAAGGRRYVGDAVVQAFPVGGGDAVATSRTYGEYGYRNGVFALYVPPGDYVVRVTPPRRLDREGIEFESVQVGSDEVRNLGYQRLNYPLGIRVRVVDSRRLQVAGAEVRLMTPQGEPLMQVTDNKGQAFFRGQLPKGYFDMVVSKLGFETLTTTFRHRANGRTKREVQIRAVPVAEAGQSVLWGVVKRAGSRRYVGDALVQAVSAEGGVVAASSLTYGGYGYKNGVYALYVPPGDYVVKVFPPDGQSGDALEAGPVTAHADEVRFLRTFKLAFSGVGVVEPPTISPTADLTEGDVVTVDPAEYSDESVVASRNFEWFAVFTYACGRADDCSSRTSFARGPGAAVVLPSWTEGARVMVVETARSAKGARLARTQSEMTDAVRGAPELVATGSPVFSSVPTQGQAVTPSGVAWNEVPDDVSYRWYVNGAQLAASDGRLTRSGSTFTPTVGDVGAWLSVEILATKAGYSPAYAYAYASRIKGADERTRLLRVNVTKADGPDEGVEDDPVTDASVWLCSVNNCYSTTFRNGTFESEVPSSQAGIEYQVSVAPFSGALLGASRSVRVTNGSEALDTTVKLEGVQPTPPAVRFPDNTPKRGQGSESTPMGFIGSPLTPFTATGCTPVDNPTWTVTFSNGATPMTGVVRTGDVAEEPGSDPRTVAYTVRIPELTSSGHATIETNFVCGSPIRFTIYIDPSGYVTDQFGRTIAGAEVTLLRSTPGAGNFAPVADRDAAVMDPAVNVRNPSLTDGTGFFRWDVAAGDYRVSVTRASSGGAACAVATTPTMSVPPIRIDLLIKTECADATTPTPTTVPQVAGVREVGRVLRLTDGAWAHGIRQTGIEWLRDGTPIAGATGNTYTLVAEDAGRSVTARVTAQRPDYAQENGSGAVVGFTAFTTTATGGGAVVAANPGGGGGGGGTPTPTPTITNTAKPAITGDAVVGGSLAASQGTWSTDGLTFAYQWLRDGEPIAGATATQYAPVVADLGKAVSVKVTATKSGSTPGTATSDPVTVEKGAAPQNSAAPEIAGTPELGETLTVSDGEWDLEDLTFGYQWLRDGEAIEGATEATYVVTEDDLGTELAAEVTASKDGHEDGSATSDGIAVPDEPDVVEPVESVTKARLLGKKVKQGDRGQVKVKVTSEAESAPTGTLTVTAGRKSMEVDLTEADNGTLKIRLPKLKPGKHEVSVSYSGDDATLASSDDAGTLKVTKKSKGKKNKGKDKGSRFGGGRPMPTLL